MNYNLYKRFVDWRDLCLRPKLQNVGNREGPHRCLSFRILTVRSENGMDGLFLRYDKGIKLRTKQRMGDFYVQKTR